MEALLARQGDCVAWTRDGRHPVEGSLQDWEGRLLPFGFMRVHRRALVNLDAVMELNAAGEVVLPSGRIAVSQRRMDVLRRALGLR